MENLCIIVFKCLSRSKNFLNTETGNNEQRKSSPLPNEEFLMKFPIVFPMHT